jgi:hypothetical protein
MITSIAALHHIEARVAFDQMGQLLAPGGTLAIVGLARSQLPADLPWEAAALITHQGHKLTRTYWEHPSPPYGRHPTPTPKCAPSPGRHSPACGTGGTCCGATH